MKNLTKFQVILLGVFGSFIIIGVIVFAIGRTTKTGSAVELLIWGTMPRLDFSEVMKVSGLDKNEDFKLTYEEKRLDSFDIDFLEALASGIGPDLFFIPAESILKYESRALTIPFRSISERNFKDSFIEGGEVFLTEGGILALPIYVDPLVMYWNRDHFNNAGIVNPPKFWDEIYDLSSVLTLRDSSLNIRRSGVALGEYINISNSFEVLSALIMQAGNSITSRGQQGTVVSTLGDNLNFSIPPTESALSFYTEFSNPLKQFYSWNRSLPLSKNYFISGDLSIYFGLASELFDIRDKNPNLNFDIASLPQVRGTDKNVTYGKIEGIAVNRQSRKWESALMMARVLSGQELSSTFSQIKSLPPARRDLLSRKPERAFMEIFYREAVIAKTWLIPDRVRANEIFKDMVESVTGGRSRPREAVIRAVTELGLLLRRN